MTIFKNDNILIFFRLFSINGIAEVGGFINRRQSMIKLKKILINFELIKKTIINEFFVFYFSNYK